MILKIIFIILNLFQLSQSKIFEIIENNGTLIIETINGTQFEIFYVFADQISEYNQIQTSKCTQNCKDCTQRQCYLGNEELDHSNLNMYDLDTQQMVLQPLTYLNDQQQNNPISRISLTKLGQYQNSFIDDGFQLCQSKTDKTIETQFQINLKDIPQQQVLLSPIFTIGGYNYIKMNYLMFGDTVIDISQCSIFFYIGKIQLSEDEWPLIGENDKSRQSLETFNINFFPNWIVNSLSLEFSKAGITTFQLDNNTTYINNISHNNNKFDSKLDFKFFNQENEQNPIIYSPEQYLIDFEDKTKIINFVGANLTKLIVLGSSFFENKKVQFNFKEHFITIQDYFEDRCFYYEKSSLYKQEILILQISIPLIILLTLFFIKYQINVNGNNGERPEELNKF